MATDRDKVVQDLFKVVQVKKAEIAKAEKPNWATNCSFGFDKNSSSRVNLQVCSDISELVEIYAFLMHKELAITDAQEELGITTESKWLGFTFEDWKSDVKTRIDKIQISKKKKELETLEIRLNGLVSKEMREQMELDEITKLLNK